MGERGVLRNTTSAAAFALLVLLAMSNAASGSEVTHTLIGVAPNAGFAVAVEGAAIPESPASSDELGILTFGFDDALYGGAPLSVTVAPAADLIIGGVTVSDVGETSAVVSWTTNLPSDSWVEYGTTVSYGQSTSVDSALVLTHSVHIDGLTDGRVYHFRVHSASGDGTAESGDSTFETVLSPLGMWDVEVVHVDTTGVSIAWQTTRPSDSRIEYGTTEVYDLVSDLDPTLVESHEVTMDGLLPGTVYHYRVRSEDSHGEVAYSADAVFATDNVPLRLTGVAAVDVGTDSAAVAWSTNRPANSSLEYGTTPDLGSTTVIDATPVTEHEVAMSALLPGTLYYYRARSEGLLGEVVHSEVGTFETDRVPLVVSGVRVVELEPETARVEWTTNRTADSSVEYGETEAYGSLSDVDSTLVGEHNVLIEGLSPGTVYHFRVCSEDGFGETATSGDSLFQTPVPPLVVSGVTVSDVTQSEATIRWTTNRPADSGVSYGATPQYEDGSVSDPEPVTEHSLTLYGLSSDTVYHFSAVSVGEWGTSSSSPDSTFATLDVSQTGAPIISNFVVERLSPTTAVASWTTNRPATTLVRYGRDEELDLTAGEDATLRTKHSVVIRPVHPNRTYSFQAESEAGGYTTCTDVCSYITVYEGHELAAKDPLIVKTGVASVSDTSAVVTWVTDRPCSTWVEFGGNDLYVRLATGDCVGDNTYHAELSGLAELSDYHYRVCARDAVGGYTVTEDRMFSTLRSLDTEPPAAPFGVTVTDGGGFVEVTWRHVGDLDVAGYRVYRDVLSDQCLGETSDCSWLAELPTDATSYEDAAVEEGRVYIYSVAAVDESGNVSERSAAARIDYGSAAAVSFSVYPNPMFDHATFAFSVPSGSGGTVSMRIVSVTGRVVRELVDGFMPAGRHTATWDGRDRTGQPVGSGVYLLEFAQAGNVSRKKLTVVN